jgi:hypothetical protein
MTTDEYKRREEQRDAMRELNRQGKTVTAKAIEAHVQDHRAAVLYG